MFVPLLLAMFAPVFAFAQQQNITPDPAMASAPPAPTSVESMMHPPPPDTKRQPPHIHADHSVTFRFVSPGAQKVELASDLSTAPLPMTKDAAGSWSVTTAPLSPEIYTYHFTVDGENVLDPSNRWHKASLLYQDNLFEVPGATAEPWDRTNVPHGAVTHYFLDSAATGSLSDYYVYTPPGYDPGKKVSYPVLYLLHGYSDGASAWVEIGRANFILDNLIAQGRTKPMIVVMPNGYGSPEVLVNQLALLSPPFAARFYANFTSSLLNEVMPAVARAYSVETGPENTAIAGLSLGGGEALVTGIAHPEKFGYVGSFSGAFAANPNDPSFKWKDPRKLLWIACGDADPLVGSFNSGLKQQLETQHVAADFVTAPGGHQWPLWREDLAKFSPLLFGKFPG